MWSRPPTVFWVSLPRVVREFPRNSVPGCDSRVIDSPGFTLAEAIFQCTEGCRRSGSLDFKVRQKGDEWVIRLHCALRHRP